jgi:NAD(P)H dehydrogenase (quinone)
MSEQVKVAVVCYSSTGTVYELAKSIVEGAEAQRVEATAEDILWADAVIFGSPTASATSPASSNSSSTRSAALGCEVARRQGLQRLHRNLDRARWPGADHPPSVTNTVHHFGGVVAAPGYTDPIKFAEGNPYGTSHIAGHGDLPITRTTRHAAAYQGARVVKIAAALKAGLHAS